MRTYRIYNLAHRLCGLAHLAQRGIDSARCRLHYESDAQWQRIRNGAYAHLRSVAQRFV